MTNLYKVIEESNSTWDLAKVSNLAELEVNYSKNPPFMEHLDHKFVNMASCSYLGLDTHSHILEGAANAIFDAGSLHLTTPRYKMYSSLLGEIEDLLSEHFQSIVMAFNSCAAATSAFLPLYASGGLSQGNKPLMIFDQHAHFSIRHIKPICAVETEIVTCKHNDLNFIEDINELRENPIFINSPGYIFWKDTNSIYQGGNQNAANLYGVMSPHDLIGKSDSDFSQKYAIEFLEQDRFVLSTGQIHVSDSDVITLKDGGTVILRTEKKPLINSNNEIVGIIGYAVDVTAEKDRVKLLVENAEYQAVQKSQEQFKEFTNSMLNLIREYQFNELNLKIAPQVNNIEEDISVPIISRLDYEILYYLSLNKTITEISNIINLVNHINISSTTIQQKITGVLYPKFQVTSRSELINKAIKFKLLKLLPDTI